MDQIKRGNVTTQHCHTDKMTSDFMSKGPQGVMPETFDIELWDSVAKNPNNVGNGAQHL